jgi:cell division septum initiation protein DivIVA
MQADRIEAENQLSTLSDRCHDREEMVRRAQRAATEIQMRAETVETELRKTVQQTSTELQRRIAQLEVSSLPRRHTSRFFILHFALLHRPLILLLFPL